MHGWEELDVKDYRTPASRYCTRSKFCTVVKSSHTSFHYCRLPAKESHPPRETAYFRGSDRTILCGISFLGIQTSSLCQFQLPLTKRVASRWHLRKGHHILIFVSDGVHTLLFFKSSLKDSFPDFDSVCCGIYCVDEGLNFSIFSEHDSDKRRHGRRHSEVRFFRDFNLRSFLVKIYHSIHAHGSFLIGPDATRTRSFSEWQIVKLIESFFLGKNFSVGQPSWKFMVV